MVPLSQRKVEIKTRHAKAHFGTKVPTFSRYRPHPNPLELHFPLPNTVLCSLLYRSRQEAEGLSLVFYTILYEKFNRS